MSDLAIHTAGLTKRYGNVTAVEQVSLSVERGEIYGFLGLNGAGKTTTIRLLLGMVHPSAGHAEIFGVRVGPGAESLWRRVGYLVESATAYPELTVRENLEMARVLQGVRDPKATDRIIEQLRLSEYVERRAGTLSLGNMQRLGLARALLHEPELLMLDEPTNGLDPAGVVEVREMLRALARERGVTVFLSSHILPEVERLVTRIGIVHRGRLLEDLSSTELEGLLRRRLDVVTRDLDRAEAILREAGFAPVRAGEADRVSLQLPEQRALERPDDIATLLVQAGVPPLRLAVVQEDIEQHFLRLTSSKAPGVQ
jgi:ABC-2 type transport system ATP-binding protein